MDLNKKLEELKPYQLNCNVFDVYSYNGLTMQDLLCQFFTKINECINVSNETIDLAKWLVNEGLEIEVVKKLMIWLEDGTLENIINVNLFNTLNEKINGLSSQIDHIVKVNDNNELNDFFNKIENNTKVKLKKSTYEVDDVLILNNKHNVEIDLNDATLKQNKHGYGVLEIKNCTNITIKGGKIIGAGEFPDQSIDNQNKILHNEKVDCPVDWGVYKNGEYESTPYNGGYLYNVSFGILIVENCKNIIIENVEASLFNYVGIGVGFRGKVDYIKNENVTIRNCYCHDNFSAGIHLMHIEGANVYNNRCENNGHPNTNQNDFDCNPGYGITCRNSNSYPTNVNIYNNICNNNKRKGIDVHSGVDININNNTVKNCNYWGIALTRFNGKVKNIIVKDNVIDSCSTVKNGVGILCDSGGMNVIENNKIFNSAHDGAALNILNSVASVRGNIISNCSTNENRNAVDISGNVSFTNNIIEHSGLKRGVSIYPKNYLLFSDNIIDSNISKAKVFINTNDNSAIDLTCSIKNNIFQSLVEGGIDLQCLNIPDGIIDGNSFTGNSVNTVNCGFYIDTNNKYYSSLKTSKKPISNMITTLEVKVEDGAITYYDTNNIISEVLDEEKGFTIKTGDFKVKGVSYIQKTTGTTDVNNLVVRNIYDNVIDIGLMTEQHPQYGQSSSTISYFNGLFTINVI
nr:MAG TPA: parallel beta-helix repeat-containing protein [Caudoviricetes sp.]